jgi:hypothetical protein
LTQCTYWAPNRTWEGEGENPDTSTPIKYYTSEICLDPK